MNILGKIYSSIIKKTYGKFNGKLFAFVAYFGCFLALAYLLLLKKKNHMVITPTNAIGDTIYIFSFWDSLNRLAQESNRSILIFVSDRYKDLLKTYKQSNENLKIVYLKHCGIKHLFLAMLSLLFKHPLLTKIALKNKIICPLPTAYMPLLNKLNYVGCRNQLSFILNLPLKPISYHRQAPIQIKSIENFKERYKRVCIVNPYSYSMYSNVQLFENIVPELKKRGYVVYTNVVQNQKAIVGTFRLDCSMQELYSIACEISLIVSVRTGLLDYLIPSGINMFVLYGQAKIGESGHESDYTLQEWNPQGKLCEVYTSRKNEERIIHEFQEFLNQLEYEGKL